MLRCTLIVTLALGPVIAVSQAQRGVPRTNYVRVKIDLNKFDLNQPNPNGPKQRHESGRQLHTAGNSQRHAWQ